MLTITEDNVRLAANSCPQAEAVLKILFPEVFSKPPVTLFEDSLREFLDDTSKTPYELFAKIPGGGARKKAQYIINMLNHF